METFVVVVALLAAIVFGALLIHRLNSQHDNRLADFHYGRFGSVLRGPAPSVRRKARGRAHARRPTPKEPA